MIRFIWKYKYFLSIILTLLSCVLAFNLKDLHVFYDTERIIEMSEADQDVIDKALDDKNLLLISVNYYDSLTYDNFIEIRSRVNKILKDQNIHSIRSIFNEQFINPGIIPIPFKVLDLTSKNTYSKFIKRNKKIKSKYISSDFKKLLYVVKIKELSKDIDKTIFLNYIKDVFQDKNKYDVKITGQIKSEIYMQKNITSELIIFTIVSCFLCSFILWYFVRNIQLVFLNLLSVIFSLIFSLSLSDFLFDGIELVMIIIPAIIFIITISDYMHLLNRKSPKKNKFDFFKQQIQNIGKPVFITSATTAIGFLSFTFSSVSPLMRFGFITTFSIFISLLIITVMYAISIDRNYAGENHYNNHINNFIDIISGLGKFNKQFILFIILIISIIGIFNLKINNYLTDEINKSSALYQEISFFDKYFGGIKPISFTVLNYKDIGLNEIRDFQDYIEQKNLTIDLSTVLNNEYIIKARMKDIGSIASSDLIRDISKYSTENEINVKIGGVGYLFDKLSNNMTREILFGLLFAILIVGVLFVLINNFNFYYFPISIIPNIIPLLSCIGILSFSSFYFSLSNAFIFAIAFGLIVDDSIHIISAYSFARKNGKSSNEAIAYCQSITFKAIIKTTIVIVISLLPLLFSEFKSISQLSLIVFISALIAIIFDLIFLPDLLRKYIK